MASPKYDDYWREKQDLILAAIQEASRTGSSVLDVRSIRSLSSRTSWRGRGVLRGSVIESGDGPKDPRPMAALLDLIARKRWLDGSAVFELTMNQAPELQIRRVAG